MGVLSELISKKGNLPGNSHFRSDKVWISGRDLRYPTLSPECGVDGLMGTAHDSHLAVGLLKLIKEKLVASFRGNHH